MCGNKKTRFYESLNVILPSGLLWSFADLALEQVSCVIFTINGLDSLDGTQTNARTDSRFQLLPIYTDDARQAAGGWERTVAGHVLTEIRDASGWTWSTSPRRVKELISHLFRWPTGCYIGFKRAPHRRQHRQVVPESSLGQKMETRSRQTLRETPL